jgi:hypothetical protein
MELSQKQSDAWHLLEDNKTTEILYGGAAGSGKSMLGCLWHIYRRTKYPGSRGLIGRAKIARLEESTLITLFEVATRLGYRRGIDFKYNEQKHRISWNNGSETLLKDLFLYPADPDFTSLGSTEFTDAFIDEVPEISRKAKQMVSSRLRWKIKEFGIQPKILMTCNPAPGWVKEDYVMNNDGKPVTLKPHQQYIHATLNDNPDEHFRNLYGKQLESLSDYDRRRLLFGDWDARPEVTNPFAFQYNEQKHGDWLNYCELKKDKVLYLSIDFNINPFALTAWHIWEDHQGAHCWCVDEIEIDNGDIRKMCNEIQARYGHWLPTCYITGDPMGKRRDIGQIDHASNYQQIQRYLGLIDQQFVLPAAPTHENSRTDFNYILFYHPDVQISKKCVNLRRDLRIVEIDAFGQIKKTNRLQISQQADFLDTGRYLFNTFLRAWKEDHQNNYLPLIARDTREQEYL